MNPQQGPFGFMMPVGFGQPPQQQTILSRDNVPARIKCAVEVLEMLTEKTEEDLAFSTSAAGGTDFERIPGQKLTAEEENLQATACNMLAKYLDGTLKATEAERTKGEQWQCMGCPFCGGGGRGPDGKKCAICSGGGSIAVAPIHSPK